MYQRESEYQQETAAPEARASREAGGLDPALAQQVLYAAGVGPAYLRSVVRQLDGAAQEQAWALLQAQCGNAFVTMVRGGDPEAEAAPAEPPRAAAPVAAADPQARRACMDELGDLAAMLSKVSPRSVREVQLFSVKAQAIARWRQVFPAGGGADSLAESTLARMERLRDQLMAKHDRLRAQGDVHYD